MGVLQHETSRDDGMSTEKTSDYRPTILLVDDDEAMLEAVKRTLEEAGYAVLVALDGVTALSLSQRYQAPIDLLLTDVIMPRMTGWDVARCLTLRRPEMKVLYMSGYSEVALFEEHHASRADCFLRKPFLRHNLIHRVRETLESPPETPS